MSSWRSWAAARAARVWRRPRGRRHDEILAGGALRVRVWDARLLASVRRLLEDSLAPRFASPQLTLTEFPRWRVRELAARGNIVMPKFVSFDLECDSPRMARDISRRWTGCAARSYGVTIHRDPAAFHFFYERLYVPTLDSRHGAEAYRRPQDYLRRGYRRGYLLFLSDGDAVVAGALNVMRQGDDSVVDHWAGGVLDGSGALVRDGADVALVIRSRQWAQRIGASRLGLTRSQPFARDGLFAFKTGFGPTLHCRSAAPTVLALSVRNWSPDVRTVVDSLSPISFGPRPTLWRCGGRGLREPAGLDILDLDAELSGLNTILATRQLRALARRTTPIRRILAT